MGLRLAAMPRAFKFIGDSHGARVDGLVFHDEDDGSYAITQAHNHYGFRASEFSSADGRINERLARSLLMMNVLRGTRENAIPALGRVRTAQEPLGWEFGLRLRQSHRNESIVISCGEVDARDVIRRLPLEARVELPVPIGRFDDDPPDDAERVTFADLAAAIETEYLAPLFRGLRTLREIGIPNLFLLAVPPPSPTDAGYEKHCGFASRRHVRYAVHRTINLLYERHCSETGIGFLNMWPLVTSPDGVLLPQFDADGVHLNRDAAVAIVAELGRLTAGVTATALDPLV